MLVYSIDNSSYVKLHDIAFAVNDTYRQFNVRWDQVERATYITRGSPYNATGNEMSRVGAERGLARFSSARTVIDGRDVDLTVYSIGDDYYYRIRDLGIALGFRVGWDGSRQRIIVDTTREPTGTSISRVIPGNPNRVIDPSRPMIALTFDDGPSRHTMSILEVFEQHNSAATFYVTGYSAMLNPDIIKRAHELGNEIAGHSWSHREMTALTESRMLSEITDINNLIELLTGVAPVSFRPPFGSQNNRVRNVAEQAGVPIVRWSIDTRDWEVRNSNTIYDTVIRNVRDGDIILFHDTQPTAATAVRRLVPVLIANGYQLVTVSELMYYSGKAFEPGVVYTSAR